MGFWEIPNNNVNGLYCILSDCKLVNDRIAGYIECAGRDKNLKKPVRGPFEKHLFKPWNVVEKLPSNLKCMEPTSLFVFRERTWKRSSSCSMTPSNRRQKKR